MPRVGEERNDGSDTLSRAGLAGGNHDAEVNEMIVDMAGSGLDDVNILASDRVLDLAATFAAGELGQDAITGRDAEDVADIVRQLRVGVAAQEDDVANHDAMR